MFRTFRAALLGFALLVTAPPLAGAPEEARLSAPVLHAPVSVVTDRWGIPHVRATSLGDLYFGWGGYSLDLLWAEEQLDLPWFDLRPVILRRLKRNPGGIDQAPAALGIAEAGQPLGEGRAGRRLAGLGALFAAVCR